MKCLLILILVKGLKIMNLIVLRKLILQSKLKRGVTVKKYLFSNKKYYNFKTEEV